MTRLLYREYKENENPTNPTVRNAGIDLLRLISMFMVVLLHVNLHGGVLNNVAENSGQWYMSRFIEQFCIIAVNLFAMISGYVNFGRKFKITNIFYLWMQVFFYTVSIYLFSVALKKDVNFEFGIFRNYALPVISNRYWYFSSYFFVFFTFPALNLIIEKSNKINASLFIVTILFLITVMGDVNNPFNTGNGYSTIWLIVMYLVGAYLKKYDFNLKFKGYRINKVIYLLMYLYFTVFGLLIYKVGIIDFAAGRLLNYTYLFNVLSAISLFLFYSKLKIKQSKILTIMSTASFGVYIISSHNYFSQDFITGKFQQYISCNPFYMALIMVVKTALIFVFCLIVDILRMYLFRLVGVNRILKKLQFKIDDFYKNYMVGSDI